MAGNRALQAKAKNGKGEELELHQQETDSPILPVAQLEHLHQFRPDLVDFVVEQTKAEAVHRRAQEVRGYRFMFIERMFGKVCGVGIGGLGLFGSGYLGLHGQPVLGGTVATVMIGSLAVAFVIGKRTERRQ